MTTISGAAGAITALTGYFQTQPVAALANATTGEPALGNVMINMVEASPASSALSPLLGSSTTGTTTGASTLSTLLSLVNGNTGADTMLASLLGNVATTTATNAGAGQPATPKPTGGYSNLMNELASPNGPAATAATSGDATSTSSTRQQAVFNALVGAYSQNEQNLLSLLV